MNIAREVRTVRAALAAVGTAERARNEKRYLKSDLRFLGATMPEIRRVARDVIARVKRDEDTALRPLAAALWDSGIHELRAVAMFLLERRVDALGARDLPLLERLLRESRSWAYLDWICFKVIAPLLGRVPALRRRVARWSRDPDFWMRRASVLTILPGVKDGVIPFSAFEAIAVPMLGEREFFIRKALGWALREISKRQPAIVARFLRAHRAELAGLTLREGIKYLPARDQRALLGR
ncbi:MAG: DNA alkylation repair protein [Gemmatimonadetes bacterium]|nr:DNA alkylation repair protein [Gemmatimonadota bacterium]